MGRRLALLLIGLAAVGVAPARATSDPGAPRVQVDLVSDVATIAPGRAFWLGFRQRIAPGWHTYWMNPGDSGEPPRIEWTLPAGFAAGEFAWPHPERIRVGSAMSYGYSHEVVLPIPVTPPARLEPGTRVTLAGRASWLVCEKECVPEEAPVSITLDVAAGPPAPHPSGGPLIAEARRAVPLPSPWPASFDATADVVRLTVAVRGLAADRLADVWFYPARWGAIDHAAPQEARVDARGVALTVARGQLPEATEASIDGVLVIAERLDAGLVRQAVSVRAAPATASGTATSLLAALALALAGGVVLNLMPCVLPVLSVKLLALVQHDGAAAPAMRRHGLIYAAGVAVAFAALAGVLIALRAAGEQIGWGFQLQSPVFVTLLAYLLFAMALALSGVFVLGAGLTGAAHALTARPRYAGSFFTGALAVVAATPCTAPFMGAAVGFALTQPWTTALLVFEALGIGMALPYLLLSLVPAWRRLLPRPGPWMVRLSRLLALPLYASVAWLVWVLSRQAGPTAVAAALTGLLLIALAAWLHRSSRDGPDPWRRFGMTAVGGLALGAVALGGLASARVAPDGASRSATRDEAFSVRRLAQLRAEGRPVFVNVTAAWCITCLVNERVALRSSTVEAAFARRGVVTLTADWTKRDPGITAVLESFGRSGVPLYVLYPPAEAGRAAGEPAVLPQLLSESALMHALDNI